MIGFTRDGEQIVAAFEQTEAQVFGLVVAQVAGLIEYDRSAQPPDDFAAELAAEFGGAGSPDDAEPDASLGPDLDDDGLGLGLEAELDDAGDSEGPDVRADAPYVDGGLGLGFDLGASPARESSPGGGPPEDPVLARLFPDGYRDDAKAAAELRSLIQGDLHSQKLDNANTMLATLPLDGGEIRLDPGQAESWLLALNDARLVLGTRLGVTDEMDILDELDDAVMRDPAGPRVLALSVYHLLGYAQETLVEALTT